MPRDVPGPGFTEVNEDLLSILIEKEETLLVKEMVNEMNFKVDKDKGNDEQLQQEKRRITAREMSRTSRARLWRKEHENVVRFLKAIGVAEEADTLVESALQKECERRHT